MAARKVNIALHEEDANVAELIQAELRKVIGSGASISNSVRYALHSTAYRLGKIDTPPKVAS